MIPPVVGVGAASLRINVLCPVDCTTMFCPGGMAGGASANVGTSEAMPQNPPTQMGKSASPCSNSTHTAAPICGMQKSPSCLPAIGTQGSAHVVGVRPWTSGTMA
jgi:hypothetical protein